MLRSGATYQVRLVHDFDIGLLEDIWLLLNCVSSLESGGNSVLDPVASYLVRFLVVHVQVFVTNSAVVKDSWALAS